MSIEQSYLQQARQLLSQHGKLTEVLCNQDSITFVYEDGYRWTDEVFMKFGYYGQGSSCFRSFLQCSGWDVSSEEIAAIRAPATLRPKQ